MTIDSKYQIYISIALVLWFLAAGPCIATETVDVEVAFNDVVNYVNDSFKTNITSGSLNRGFYVSFLSTNMRYYVKVEEYIPSNSFVFEARSGQIGSEKNRFVITRLQSDKTRISVTRQAQFIFPLPTEGVEKQIIANIENGLRARDVEGDGVRPQE